MTDKVDLSQKRNEKDKVTQAKNKLPAPLVVPALGELKLSREI